MYKMVDFGKDTETALVALCAAFVAIVVWAVGAWYFGIPTSESHALIAGVTGAAIAINGFKGAINMDEWLKVIKGLFFSTVLGFVVGFIFGGEGNFTISGSELVKIGVDAGEEGIFSTGVVSTFFSATGSDSGSGVCSALPCDPPSKVSKPSCPLLPPAFSYFLMLS